MSRPTIDEWAMSLAMVTAQRTTCLKRQVGAVLLCGRNHVLSTGYNGVARGEPHCNEEVPGGPPSTKVWYDAEADELRSEEVDIWKPRYPNACPGALLPPGSGGPCKALHAEWNAILQCPDVHRIRTCYVTTAPCEVCARLLLGTSCERIAFLESHDGAEAAQRVWTWEWFHMPWTPFLRSHQGSYTGFLTRPLPA